MAAAAATGILSAPGVGASALSSGQGQSGGSPGVLSGNSVAAPVSVPVDVCGNSVDAVGALNPATGNTCAATDADAVASKADRQPRASSGTDMEVAAPPADTPAPRSQGGAHADGGAQSGGVLSGNSVQAPMDVGLNVCGDTVDVVGALDPALGNACAGDGKATAVPTPAEEDRPPAPHEDPKTPPTVRAAVPEPRQADEDTRSGTARGTHVRAAVARQTPVARGKLADTGADPNLLAALSAGSALLLGGGILYRRAAARR
ncbi:chaplin [Streptomyces sp. NPDC102406]|uniref:chaplin n=1 Tax=Streptomyces sp. NPDC102406 TaxID=3366171 RepID=UPI0038073104